MLHSVTCSVAIAREIYSTLYAERLRLRSCQTIVQQIENIIVGYGANELFPLLQEAAKIVSQKFSKDDRLLEARANQFYYLHGQEQLRVRRGTQKKTRHGHNRSRAVTPIKFEQDPRFPTRQRREELAK
jgi:hypothetical protein